MRKCYVPPEHSWFFKEICNSSHQKYLLHRRLLPTSLHQPLTIVAKKINREVDISKINIPSHSFILNGIHSLKFQPESPTYLKVWHSPSALHISIRCEDRTGISFNRREEQSIFKHKTLKRLCYVSDYVALFFDVKHNHCEYTELILTPSGNKATLFGRQTGSLHPVNPFGTLFETRIASNIGWKGTATMDKDKKGWLASFTVPFAFLKEVAGIKSIPPVIGFNALRIKRSLPPEQSVLSPVNWFGENAEFPLRFGDLYLSNPPVIFTNIWLGEGFIGKNYLVINALKTSQKANGNLIFKLRHKFTLTEKKERLENPPIKIQITGKKQLIKIPYDYDKIAKNNIMEIAVQNNSKNSPFFFAAYPMQFYLRPGKRPAISKTIADPSWKEAIKIASKLPRLIRVSTADGAPSDFSLRTEDGKTTIDLMKENAMRLLAEIIEKCFRTDEERLAAASILIAQPDVMVYEIIDRFGECANTPLSIIRFGSGICGAFATAIKGLIEELRPINGKGHFRAYRCGIWDGKLPSQKSHCMVAVHCPDGRWVVLDNGRLIYAKRNGKSSLATLTDTSAIQQKINWVVPYKKWHILDSGSQIWPAGAPL